MEIKIKEEKVRKFAFNVCKKIGLSEEDAFIFSDSLIYASLRGVDSHGIMRLPYYIQRIELGGTNIKPNIKIIKEKSGTILIDGDNGLGQVVGTYAAKLAVNRAKETGIASVGVRGSSHFGAAQYYAVKIADKNMVGFATTNGYPGMAAWGGAKNVICNNPFAIAVSYKKEQPLVLDIAMSNIAGGKVILAAKNKQKIPKGLILNKNGKDSEDPNDLFNGGAVLPFAQHKGYGLAFMIEIIAGALTGAGMLRQIPLWFKDLKGNLNIGHFFVAINIESYMNILDFRERLYWIAKEIKASPLKEGSKSILLPGEIEWETEIDRRKNGIPISDEVLEDLKQLSKKFKEKLEA